MQEIVCRRKDTPLYIINTQSRKGKETKKVSSEALMALMEYPWRGNVRELRNMVERLVTCVEGEVIGLKIFHAKFYQIRMKEDLKICEAQSLILKENT